MSVQGACLTLQIQPSQAVTRIDSLTILTDLDGSSPKSVSKDHATDLPVLVGVALDSLPAGRTTVDVSVEGDLNGAPIGQASIGATVTSGQHETIDVFLLAIVDGPRDLGTSDLAASPSHDLSMAARPDLSVQAGIVGTWWAIPKLSPGQQTLVLASETTGTAHLYWYQGQFADWNVSATQNSTTEYGVTLSCASSNCSTSDPLIMTCTLAPPLLNCITQSGGYSNNYAGFKFNWTRYQP